MMIKCIQSIYCVKQGGRAYTLRMCLTPTVNYSIRSLIAPASHQCTKIKDSRIQNPQQFFKDKLNLKPSNHAVINFLHIRDFRTASGLMHKLDARDPDQDEKEKDLIRRQESEFDNAASVLKAKNAATFKMAVAKFAQKESVYRKGHVEFLYAALKRMKEFGVNRDLQTYKLLFELFPKGKMVPQSMWQVEMMHYPKQQQCCIDILSHMEDNGVIPDDKVGAQLVAVFGKRAHAFRKYQRMMYWMPKFKYANPYFIPQVLPEDPTELARMALKRMSVDLQNKISVFDANELENSLHKTFIVSAQSPVQCRLLREHPENKPFYVEGGFTTWLRGEMLTYFVLRSDTSELYKAFKADEPKLEENDTRFTWNFLQEEKMEVAIPPSIHEQDDGTILAMCITGTGSKDSLASWIKFLERSNPRLANSPVIFLLRTPEQGIKVIESEKQRSQTISTV